jgi:hypothetical protein
MDNVDKSHGGPAFAHGDPVHGGDPGMSLRDYFAGQFATSIPIRSWETAGGKTPPNVFDLWAEACYAASEALLRARAKAKIT